MFEPSRNRMRLLLSVLMTAIMLGAALPGVLAVSGEPPAKAGPRSTDDANDLIVASGETYELSGCHTYANSIQIDGTLKVKPYDGSDDNTGIVWLQAKTVTIGSGGSIVADGRGFGGGGAGSEKGSGGGKAGVGGKGGNGDAGGYWGAGGGGGSNGGLGGAAGSYGYAGAVGTETGGGAGGNDWATGYQGGTGGTGYGGGGGGGAGWYPDGAGGGGGGSGGKDASVMTGGAGGGPAGGAAGGAGGANKGANGGYAVANGNGDTSTGLSISKGSGGGGGSTAYYYGGAGGGGAGGGAVALLASGDLSMSGKITANGGGGGNGGRDGSGNGGNGGGGGGGGVLLSGLKVTVSGTINLQGRDQNALSSINAGTLKVFYSTKVMDGATVTAGRTYTNGRPIMAGLLSPQPGEAMALPTFTWKAAIDPDSDAIVGYEVLVSDKDDFSNKIIDQIVSSTTYTSPSVMVGPEFFWKVRAKDFFGWGPWTEPWKFLADNTPPTSSVQRLPKWTLTTDFPISWEGTDDMTGIGYYLIFVSDNRQEFELWTNTTETTQTFHATDGHSYRFFSTAVDRAANTEEAPEEPQATTTVDASAPVSTLAPMELYQKTATFNVNWTASDKTSGVSNYTVYVSDSGGAFKPWLVNVTKKTDKYEGKEGHEYKFYVRARDVAGNFENTPSPDGIQTVKIDLTPPRTTMTILGDTFGTRPVFITQPTPIVLLSKDNYTGVAATTYSLDGQTGQSYLQPLKNIDTGSHNLTFWSTDAAGNLEKRQSLWFYVDGDAPSTTLTFSGPSYSSGAVIYLSTDTVFTLNVRDTGCGVRTTDYHFDNMDSTIYSEPFKFDKTGAHTLYYSSVDNLGNLEKEKNKKIVVDRTAPATTAVAPFGPQREDVLVRLKASDFESGICATYYRITGPDGITGEWQPGTEMTLEALADHSADGTSIIEFYSVDNVGNIEPTRSLQVVIDTATTLTLAIKGSADTDQGSYVIKGKAEPGSRVSVNGRTAQVASDGTFAFELDLEQGSNRVTVFTTDPAGNTATLTRTINYNVVSETPMWLIGLLVLIVICVAAVAVVAYFMRGGKKAVPPVGQRVPYSQRPA